MCTTVWYVYGCGHNERAIYRCPRALGSASTTDQFNECVEREALARGTWTTRLGEGCHDCFEAARRMRRQRRHDTRAPPGGFLFGPTMTNPDATPNQESNATLSPQQQQEFSTRDGRVHAQQLRRRQQGMRQEQEEQEEQEQQEQRHFLRSQDDTWMSYYPQRNSQGMIRPLETNLLQNIDRVRYDGVDVAGMTPTQIWRLQQIP